jgi:hypothetical protein
MLLATTMIPEAGQEWYKLSFKRLQTLFRDEFRQAAVSSPTMTETQSGFRHLPAVASTPSSCRAGFDKYGFNKDGYDRSGYSVIGFDKDGFDANGYNIRGFGKDGYNKEGYNQEGFDRCGHAYFLSQSQPSTQAVLKPHDSSTTHSLCIPLSNFASTQASMPSCIHAFMQSPPFTHQPKTLQGGL